MNTIPMTAEHRTAVRRGLGALRRSGKLPAVLYGADKTPVTLQLNSREASRTLNRIVGTALIDLDVHGENHKALVREIQRNFVTDEILHVDFYEVAMDRVMRVYVPVRQVGVAPAVTLLGGILVRGLADIEIECLPGDLISGIEVDLTVLKAIGDSVHVSDLQVPSTIKVLTHGDEQVARVTYASTEELTAEKPEVAAEVEVVEKGKKEEEGEEE
nr:50S ribosomal protein L25 [Chloroflexota bacterium]